VHLVTGGFHQIVQPIATRLNISSARVHANRIHFSADGEYAGFDTSEPTAGAGGKRVAVAAIKSAAAVANRPCIAVMVGDGATDAEARGPGAADLFVAYGGVKRRPAVAASADWCVTDLRVLMDHL
jgi:phosphoserine phosphatase